MISTVKGRKICALQELDQTLTNTYLYRKIKSRQHRLCNDQRTSRFPDIRLKTHGVENRRRFSTPIRTCSISRSIFGSTWSIETVVIGLSLMFSFGLFVNSAESVNKHFDYIFFLISLRFATIWMHNCSSNSIVVTFFGHVCFRRRKSAPIFEVENRRRFSTRKIGVENRRRFSTPCVFSLRAVHTGRSCGPYVRVVCTGIYTAVTFEELHIFTHFLHLMCE